MKKLTVVHNETMEFCKALIDEARKHSIDITKVNKKEQAVKVNIFGKYIIFFAEALLCMI